jgi:ligand-binding SRPBCC domain-containing protein
MKLEGVHFFKNIGTHMLSAELSDLTPQICGTLTALTWHAQATLGGQKRHFGRPLLSAPVSLTHYWHSHAFYGTTVYSQIRYTLNMP